MPLPKKIKKNIPLTESKILLDRRKELVDKINQDGTYLPKSILHADLDGGFLDFVKNDLKLVVEGKVVPNVDIIITTQNWSQFVQTWDFQNIDKNVEPPFITVIRVPEVKYGTNPAVLYTIPNRRLFFYAQVPTWDGNRVGMDIYKIPQPVPVDITFQVKIVCNRMRELNAFNKIVIEKFSSKQAYTVIKGHYIPIVMGNISDESVMDLEKRKYYIQKYEFTMMGFLIDEEQFEVFPAISRTFQVIETDQRNIKRKQKKQTPIEFEVITLQYLNNVTTQEHYFEYTCNLLFERSVNIEEFSVYINEQYYGDNVETIQINTNDMLRIDIISSGGSEDPYLLFTQILV